MSEQSPTAVRCLCCSQSEQVIPNASHGTGNSQQNGCMGSFRSSVQGHVLCISASNCSPVGISQYTALPVQSRLVNWTAFHKLGICVGFLCPTVRCVSEPVWVQVNLCKGQSPSRIFRKNKSCVPWPLAKIF